MVETIFEFLNSVGFKHPLHPALTHIPMGMVMGAFIFRVASLLPRMKFLAKTGYHCIVLALLWIAPAVFAGYLDWQHTFGGAMDFLIGLKIALAVIFTGFLIAILVMDDPENPKLNRITLFYFITLLLTIGLGFSGGELTQRLIHAAAAG